MWQLRGRHGFSAGWSQSDFGWKHRPRLRLCCRATEKRDDSDAMKAKSHDVPPVSGVVLHLRCWLWTRKHPTKWWRSMSKQRIRWHAKLYFAKFRVNLEIFIDFPGDPAELFVGGGHGSPFLLGHALWLGVLDEISMKSWNRELMNGIWRVWTHDWKMFHVFFPR